MVELLNVDCMEYMAGLPDSSIDMVLTDPPYGSLDIGWDKAQDYSILFPELFRVCKENAAILITSQQPYATDVINACRKFFRYEIIWEKTQKLGFVNANKMPLRGHENILVFYKKLPVFNPQKYKASQDKMSWGRTRKKGANRYEGYSDMGAGPTYHETGDRFPHSVIQFSNWNGALFGKKERSSIHPTQKPIDLFRYLINTYSNIGDIIFDPFSGSGTTAIASHMEGRKCKCCELNEDYFNSSVVRYNDYFAQQSMF